MTWTQESQYRHQFSTDGREGMAWQQTSVWRSGRAKKSRVSTTRNVEEILDGFLFFAAFVLAVTAEEYVSGVGFLLHLPDWLRGSLLIITMIVSFIASAAVLYSGFVRVLIKFVFFGAFTLLAAGIVLPVLWHFL